MLKRPIIVVLMIFLDEVASFVVEVLAPFLVVGVTVLVAALILRALYLVTLPVHAITGSDRSSKDVDSETCAQAANEITITAEGERRFDSVGPRAAFPSSRRLPTRV